MGGLSRDLHRWDSDNGLEMRRAARAFFFFFNLQKGGPTEKNWNGTQSLQGLNNKLLHRVSAGLYKVLKGSKLN